MNTNQQIIKQPLLKWLGYVSTYMRQVGHFPHYHTVLRVIIDILVLTWVVC